MAKTLFVKQKLKHMRNFTTKFMKQYTWRECLEISGIPPSVKDNKLETKVLSILEETDTL